LLTSHYPLARHGVVDQEAPQANAEKKAQEDVEGDPLATPRRREVTG
jgi:hypothetical protein